MVGQIKRKGDANYEYSKGFSASARKLFVKRARYFPKREKVELRVTPQKWENCKLMGEFIIKLLKANNMKVNGYKLAEANVYNIYYIDVETLTVERRLS